MALRWYVVHAYSNFEHKVASGLKDRVKMRGLEDKFGEILVPTEEVVEMRDGQKRRSDRKFFPGYVLVQMDMDEDTWHLVKEVPKVLGFIGGTPDKPAPITEADILGPSEAARARMDYYSHTKNARSMIERLAAAKPTTLACMHGSAWRGDGAALLRALADTLCK